MTEAQAHVAYNVLVLYAGASPAGREEFASHVTQTKFAREYRFQGCLGFGGKFYWNGAEARVSCYNDDRTPERENAIKTTNNLLEDLFDEPAPV